MPLRFGRSVWRYGQGCFSVKTRPRASWQCARCWRGGPRARHRFSGAGFPCPRLGSGEARSCPLNGPILYLIAPIRPLQLCADGGYQLRFRGLGGTPNLWSPTLCVCCSARTIVSPAHRHQSIVMSQSIPCFALFVCHPKVEERSNFYTLPPIVYV
jgi:hypothetical protein